VSVQLIEPEPEESDADPLQVPVTFAGAGVVGVVGVVGVDEESLLFEQADAARQPNATATISADTRATETKRVGFAK
jgi:hypothetical protein